MKDNPVACSHTEINTAHDANLVGPTGRAGSK